MISMRCGWAWMPQPWRNTSMWFSHKSIMVTVRRDAKRVIDVAGQWRKRIDREEWACKLCPILMVRYAGAAVYNPPNRVASQILGTIAEGADGVVLYYPELMDAPYWTMLAEVTRQVGRFEAYYTQGKRVDDQFAPIMMDEGQTLVSPHAKRIPVENPSWHFTAHEWDGKTLLTLQNLHEGNDMWFRFEMAGGKDAWEIAESLDAPQYSGGWLIPPAENGLCDFEAKGKRRITPRWFCRIRIRDECDGKTDNGV